jgi:hypothetical protein
MILPSLVTSEKLRERETTAAKSSTDKEVNFYPTIPLSLATRFETNNFTNLVPYAAEERTLHL